MSEPNVPDAFLSLLSNPEMLSTVAKLISNTSQDSSSVQDSSDTDKKNNSEAVTPDISGIIASALSNPAIMSALPKMLGTLSSMPNLTVQNTDEPKNTKANETGGLGAILPALAGVSSGCKNPPKPTDRRSALLLALKPYMSHDKAEMIDTIVRIIEIMTLIK